MKIGFIGLGIMGSRMASNLLKNGVDLTVYNRTKSIAEKDERLARAVANSTRIRQFSIAQARYLIKSTRLPADFEEVLGQDFDELRKLVG